MAQKRKKDANSSKQTLTRERVIEGAIYLADRSGTDQLTIRKLADYLGSAPMSLYYHIQSKDLLLDAMVEHVFAQITTPPEHEHWKSAIRVRCLSVREVLKRHWWAPPLMESRDYPGPENLRHLNAVIGCFRRAGFSIELCAHAYAVLDSYLYGFALEEASLPSQEDGALQAIGASIVERLSSSKLEYLAELTTKHVLQPGCSFGASFEFGLDLLLDGIERALFE